MKTFSRKSIRIRIYISIFILLLAIGSAIVFSVHKIQEKHGLTVIKNLNIAMANFIAESTRQPLKDRSYYLLEEIALGVMDIPHVVFFDISDTNGTSFLAEKGSLGGKNFDRTDLLSIKKGITIAEKEITYEGEHLGTVTIATSTKRYRKETLNALIEIVSYLTTGLIILGLIIVFSMEKFFVSPIIKLAKTVETVGKGTFVTTDLDTRKDEIGHLAKTFNKMSRNLESLVEERTSKISLANSLLRNEIKRRSLLEAQLKQAASIDPLTKISNRYSFENRLNGKIQSATGPLSLIMFDLDKFKEINDRYGHTVGDKVLKNIVRLTNMEIDDDDIFCRWGGEEFLIATPLSLRDATLKAERIRTRFESYKDSHIPTATASFGVSQFIRGEKTQSVFVKVDDLMYEAKKSGRNRVISS